MLLYFAGVAGERRNLVCAGAGAGAGSGASKAQAPAVSGAGAGSQRRVAPTQFRGLGRGRCDGFGCGIDGAACVRAERREFLSRRGIRVTTPAGRGLDFFLPVLLHGDVTVGWLRAQTPTIGPVRAATALELAALELPHGLEAAQRSFLVAYESER